MVRVTKRIFVEHKIEGGKLVPYNIDEIYVNSSDSKPTSSLCNGSICIEVDTGKIFLFNEATSGWVEHGALG